MTYPSGLSLTFSRDVNGRISGISAENQVIADNIAYMPFGPVKNVKSGPVTISRAYNSRYLVTNIQAGTLMNLSYAYDGAGNVKTISGIARAPLSPGVTEYSHAGGRLTESTGKDAKNYVYDAAGNIISDGIFTFVYNHNSRLAQVRKGSLIIGEYFYDGFGRRVKKVASGKTIHYHYDISGLLICETTGLGILSAIMCI